MFKISLFTGDRSVRIMCILILIVACCIIIMVMLIVFGSNIKNVRGVKIEDNTPKRKTSIKKSSKIKASIKNTSISTTSSSTSSTSSSTTSSKTNILKMKKMIKSIRQTLDTLESNKEKQYFYSKLIEKIENISQNQAVVPIYPIQNILDQVSQSQNTIEDNRQVESYFDLPRIDFMWSQNVLFDQNLSIQTNELKKSTCFYTLERDQIDQITQGYSYELPITILLNGQFDMHQNGVYSLMFDEDKQVYTFSRLGFCDKNNDSDVANRSISLLSTNVYNFLKKGSFLMIYIFLSK